MNDPGQIVNVNDVRGTNSFIEISDATDITAVTQPDERILKADTQGSVQIKPRSPLEVFENRLQRLPENEEELSRYELTQADSVSIVYRWFPTELYVADTPVPREGLPNMNESIELDYVFPSGKASLYQWHYKELRFPDENGRLRIEGVYLDHQADASEEAVNRVLLKSDLQDPTIALDRLRTRLQMLQEAVYNCPDLKRGETTIHEGLKIEAKNESHLLTEISFLNQIIKNWYFPAAGYHPVVPEWIGSGQDSHHFSMNMDLLCGAFPKYRAFIALGPLKINFNTDMPLLSNSGDCGKIMAEPSQLEDMDQKIREALENIIPGTKMIFHIRGYADSQGSRDHNMELSRIRAEWLKSLLEKKFRNAVSAIYVKWYGDDYARTNSTGSRSDQNHRVAILEIASSK